MRARKWEEDGLRLTPPQYLDAQDGGFLMSTTAGYGWAVGLFESAHSQVSTKHLQCGCQATMDLSWCTGRGGQCLPSGSQSKSCAALPRSGGSHRMPAAALSSSPRRALLLQEVAGTH